MTYTGPGEVWAPDTVGLRECRRWDKKRQEWRWKVRFASRKEAAQGPGKGSVLYVCPHCNFWHRASAPPPPPPKET